MLDRLNWLLGTWTMDNGSQTTIEEWQALGESVYQGSGRNISLETGEEIFQESLLLVEMAGGIFYIAKVSHNEMPVPFKLVEQSPDHARFENLEHDFPKRIEYKRIGEDQLEVQVSDTGEKGFVLKFQRAEGD